MSHMYNNHSVHPPPLSAGGREGGTSSQNFKKKERLDRASILDRGRRGAGKEAVSYFKWEGCGFYIKIIKI